MPGKFLWVTQLCNQLANHRRRLQHNRSRPGRPGAEHFFQAVGHGCIEFGHFLQHSRQQDRIRLTVVNMKQGAYRV